MNPEKLNKYLKNIIRISFLVSLASSIYYLNYFIILISTIGLILTFFSQYFEKKYKFTFSSYAQILILILIYLSLFLGEINQFYLKFWWWDLMLHGFSGFLFGLVGFSLVYIINQKSTKIELNPFFVALFGFCFSMTIGVFWEFFEFFIDSAFGTNMLKSGLVDTFFDLILNFIGAITISLVGYNSLKHNFSKEIKKIKNFISTKNNTPKL